MARVIAAMSGGVDSSVAAWLLRQQGHEVIGVFMRHGIDAPQANSGTGRVGQAGRDAGANLTASRVASGDIGSGSVASGNVGSGDFAASGVASGGIGSDSVASGNVGSGDFAASGVAASGVAASGVAAGAQRASAAAKVATQGCCTAADAADVRRVSDWLGIPFYVLNFEREFERIVEYFVDEYAAGRTPNPCIRCNTWLKFGKLFEYADAIGAELIATGHYARLLPCGDGQLGLFRAVDQQKDQSYVLFGVRRELLPRLTFPLGELTKTEVRRIAQRLGMCVARKPDSQEICFAPKGAHWRLVRQRRPELDTSGEIVDTDGRPLGRHEGFERFTIGQRKGLRVALGWRQYVVRIEPDSKRVVIGDKQELARSQLTASDVNWLIEPPGGELACKVKIRYRSPAVDAVIEPLGPRRIAVRFLEPCYAVTPGQAVVCYRHDQVLGGGWID